MPTQLILNISSLILPGIALILVFVKGFSFKDKRRSVDFLLLGAFLLGWSLLFQAVRQYFGGIDEPGLDFSFMQVDQVFGLYMIVPTYTYILMDLTKKKWAALVGSIFSAVLSTVYLYFIFTATQMEYNVSQWGTEYELVSGGGKFFLLNAGILALLVIINLLAYLIRWWKKNRFYRNGFLITVFIILIIAAAGSDETSLSEWVLLSLRLLYIIGASGVYLVVTSEDFSKERKDYY